MTLIASAIGLAFVFASPAEAAKLQKHKRSAVHAIGYRHSPAYAQQRPAFQGGVLAGPLYNGPDYLGDDPDPNIRAYILRDLTGRYGGGGL